MIEYFADLHIHVGWTRQGEPVKITASRSLTVDRILEEAAGRKGLDAVGIVDCASTAVLREIEVMLDSGELESQPGGGLRYQGRLTVFLAAEVGVDAAGREAHLLCYLPDFPSARRFSEGIRPYVTNPQLSSQKLSIPPGRLVEWTAECGGFVALAHAFTPHKGFYGHCADRLTDVFTEDQISKIPVVELGLSADSLMASRLSELDGKALIANSDAHSLAKIAREYNKVRAADLSFEGLHRALAAGEGGVAANYGLHPALGKYHTTHCLRCRTNVPLLRERLCPRCGSADIVVGVADRLEELADRELPLPSLHPPYIHQVPLEFIPGVGPATLKRLLDAFGSEMNVLHRASVEELQGVVRPELAARIDAARRGLLSIAAGGGGVYGRIVESL